MEESPLSSMDDNGNISIRVINNRIGEDSILLDCKKIADITIYLETIEGPSVKAIHNTGKQVTKFEIEDMSFLEILELNKKIKHVFDNISPFLLAKTIESMIFKEKNYKKWILVKENKL